MKKYLLILIIFFILGIGFLFYQLYFSTAIINKHFYKSLDDYELNINYPFIPNYKFQYFDNLIIKDVINSNVFNFQNNLKSFSLRNSTSGIKSYLTINYKVIEATSSFIGVLFDLETYIAGTPHPFDYYDVLNFDLNSNKKLQLSDLFVAPSSYLQKISDFAAKDIIQQIKQGKYDSSEGYIKSCNCLSPVLDNFKNFIINKSGLSFYFPVYVLGPYAAGPAQINIPWLYLNDVLNSNTKDLIQKL
ncbi:MAG: RsiV family protein [Minisyncoccia bacterium]